jgi:hypothetical protein
VNAARPRVLDWTAVLAGLSQLNKDNPSVLDHNVLVGGAACMFFRDQLEQNPDPDFQVRPYGDEEEKYWLSRDADFATSNPAEIPDLAGNVPLGRLQFGFVLGADEFKENARRIDLTWATNSFSMLIADPLDLWREKEAATQRRSSPQDALHLEILSLTLQKEMVSYAELVAAGKLSAAQWISRASEVKRRFTAVFANPNVERRIKSLQVDELTQFAYPSL